MRAVPPPWICHNRPVRLLRLLCLALLAFACRAAEPRFTAELWSDIRPIYAKTLEHPFLKGLSDGSLPRSRFQFYLIQDAQYLRAFARALSVLAAKSPRDDWAATLNRHAASSIESERQLHESILRSFGVPPAAALAAPMAPVNYAYTNHLLAVAYQQPFARGLAALLPCYWIYWEAGKELKKKGSKDPDYQRWIDLYSGEDYGKVVQQVLDMMDSEAARLDADSRRAVKALFRTSARYEWMFWDMAWREEKWQPEVP
ncbi:MAG: thiaminase II [Acidobacteria bacterium]|nr:thiaminase II [Acidobacteriota bacterium]